MNNMKIYLTKTLIVFAILFSSESYSQKIGLKSSDLKIVPMDLKIILGDWNGTLTYLDYSSGKPYTLPANLTVKQGRNEYELLLLNSYPNEPEANSREKIKISEDGKQLNKKHIKSKQRLPKGQIQIITEYKGKDNKRNALIRNIYILAGKQFLIRKEVQFENSDTWIMRNEYNYLR